MHSKEPSNKLMCALWMGWSTSKTLGSNSNVLRQHVSQDAPALHGHPELYDAVHPVPCPANCEAARVAPWHVHVQPPCARQGCGVAGVAACLNDGNSVTMEHAITETITRSGPDSADVFPVGA